VSSAEPLFIKKQKLADIVADKLLEMFREGELRQGQKLPAERDLAVRFGVSRASLRDAIRHLELLGYLEVRQGGGTFVRAPDGQTLTQPFQRLLSSQPHLADDLVVFRFLLEPEVAAFAAKHCTEGDAAQLRGSLTKQQQLVLEEKRLAAEDVRFHHLIARTAKNVTVLHVLDTLQALLDDLRARLLTGDQPKLTLLQHSNIADAIIRHDPDAARVHMTEHLEAVMHSVRREEKSPQSI
jgi:GntR family transcriptional repressor for pyruvate dehydrogenase complex